MELLTLEQAANVLGISVVEILEHATFDRLTIGTVTSKGSTLFLVAEDIHRFLADPGAAVKTSELKLTYSECFDPDSNYMPAPNGLLGPPVSDVTIRTLRITQKEVARVKRILDAQGTSTASSGAQTVTSASRLVAAARLSEVRTLKVAGYDLTRLVQLCEELNACYQVSAYHAVIILTRAILDHVPPLFGCKDFAGVANNYAGPRSFKQAMEHLHGGARKIADLHLHSPVGTKESLPNAIQVNFSQLLDLLLAEIVKRHKVTGS